MKTVVTWFWERREKSGVAGEGGFENADNMFSSPFAFLSLSLDFDFGFFLRIQSCFSLLPLTAAPLYLSNLATLSRQIQFCQAQEQAIDPALWSRKLAKGQGWKIYTRLHNIAYLYLRWTLSRAGSCEQTGRAGVCVINWRCVEVCMCVCLWTCWGPVCAMRFLWLVVCCLPGAIS